MNVCVLGGSGFVGTELVIRLALAGHWVRVPTRNLTRAERLRVLDTVELLVANVHEPRILSQLFSACDAVVNLVGILNPRRGASFDAVHTELAAKVMAAARTAGVRRVLHVSALGADPRAPSRYLRSKAAAEARLRAAPRSELSHAEPAVTIFRPSVIFGPGDSLTNRFAGLLRLTLGCLPLARARARFAPICVFDVAEAMVRALGERASAGQTYELCGPQVMTLAEIVRLTARVARLPCRIVPLPDPLARLQGLAMGILPGKPFSLDNFRSLTLDSVCREDGCRRLGITPRPMLAVLPTYLEPRRPAAFA
ncbi:MAG: complex I NDUFA9 subunit family protein [Gammaproteobacteria bacterium]|nr:MAG: complex I NDUFA9 subunit family protein [Gammaproteobacteria bacterium]TLY85163.1 MAG: complex I NDUFA9 subunit family protein [Gammaproteobacteria bacterium]